jgi:transcriptional regulator with XRE-family HTH domain
MLRGMREPLSVVVGRNCQLIRSRLGVTQEQFVRYAREVGLRWTASKVGDFERGRRELAFGTVLGVSAALARAQADAKERGVAVGSPVTLADLVWFDGNVVLTADGPDPLGAVVANVCRGRPWPLDPVKLMGEDEVELQGVYKKVVDSALSSAMVDGYFDPDVTAAELAMTRQRSGLAEDRLAQRLKISRDRLAALSFRLWQHTFSEERDRRAGPDANQQKRGRISRDLRAEIEEALADGNS